MRELDDTLRTIWQLIGRGAADRRHGFHWPVVCTIGAGAAEGRVVVLRGADPATRRVWFHTDIRSAKIEQLDGLSWMFYDPKARMQVRIHGTTTLAGDATADREWDGLPASSRRTYLVEPAPGTALGDQWSSGRPEADADRLPSPSETAPARANFAVVVTVVHRLESLKLGRAGHERARFEWLGDELHATWLVP
ncbi:MAG: pyridoxamine 5'-phosphate oxidase [Myxococcota bacterium]